MPVCLLFSILDICLHFILFSLLASYATVCFALYSLIFAQIIQRNSWWSTYLRFIFKCIPFHLIFPSWMKKKISTFAIIFVLFLFALLYQPSANSRNVQVEECFKNIQHTHTHTIRRSIEKLYVNNGNSTLILKCTISLKLHDQQTS